MSFENQSPGRTSWSLIVSTFLHGSVIAFVALGPTFLPNFYGNRLNYGPDGVNPQATTVAIETISSEPTTVKSTTPVALQQAEAPLTLSDMKSVAVQVPVKRVKAATQPESLTLPEKSVVEVEPQPIATQPIEPQPIVSVKESEQETIAVEQQPLPPPTIAAEEEVIAETELTTEPVVEPTTTEPTIEKTATVASTEPAPAAIITQSYLELKQLSGNKPPTYPREVRLKKEQGRGQLVYFVTKEGSVSQLKLTKSTGSPKLDQTAIEAFSKYKFVPGQDGYTVHDFEFSLKGPERAEAGRLRTSMNNN